MGIGGKGIVKARFRITGSIGGASLSSSLSARSARACSTSAIKLRLRELFLTGLEEKRARRHCPHIKTQTIGMMMGSSRILMTVGVFRRRTWPRPWVILSSNSIPYISLAENDSISECNIEDDLGLAIRTKNAVNDRMIIVLT